MGKYNKLIMALVGAIVMIIVAILEQFTSLKIGEEGKAQIVGVVIAILTAFGVYAVPNKTA
jgi:hypothetical protein